jgi:hypothetical protein
MKTCTVCATEKDLSDFYRHSTTRDRHDTRCKACANTASLVRAKNLDHVGRAKRASYMRRWRYGLEEGWYEKTLESQGGLCAICGQTCASGKRLSVDHDHESGRVRGLLCARCNMSIGKFNHDIDLLARAITYLETM